MKDNRLKALEEQLVNYSVALKKGEHLLINCTADEVLLVKEIMTSAYKIGAYPHIKMNDEQLTRILIQGLSDTHADVIAAYEKNRIDYMDAYINVSTTRNPMENSGLSHDKTNLMAQTRDKFSEKIRSGKVKWCSCIYPTPYYANCAGMSLEDFENYYFDVCVMDYQRFGQEMNKLKLLLDQADAVRIKAPGTDLSFSVKGIDKCVSAGDRNIPDGEVYTAPVLESVNGFVSFNVPSVSNGKRFDNIRLVFKNGQAVETHANYNEDFKTILNIDEGARYIGEFAFGLNPKLHNPVGVTLFDEKIRGSVHFAMGQSLDLADNGNRSAIHWDLVLMLTKEKGGGEIFIDGTLIFKDGEFVLNELHMLNKN